MTMRVLHFLDTVNRGGAETQVLDVCRNARTRDMEITFVTAQGGALEDEFRASGAEFIRLERRFPVDVFLASQLRRIIREREIEIVHGYQAVEGIHLYLATRGLKNVRRVLSFQGGTLYDWKNIRALKFLIPRMDANVVVSRSLKKWHTENDNFETKNFTVIYNGADAKRLQPAGKNLRKELALSANVSLIGMIGNFYREPRKDQLTLCRALPKIFAEFDNAHCVFAGKIENGAEEKFADCFNFCLEKDIADRVHFLGARADVPDILAVLDVFVFSSLHEGLPIAVCEAMLAKVPLVLSDIDPLREVSGDGEYAEIFPVKNDDELAEKVSKLLKNDALRKDSASRAYEFAKENFSIEAHLDALRKLYENILRR